MMDPRHAVLSVDAMGAADTFAMEHGRSGGALMDAAGAAIAGAIMERWSPRPIGVLCGPGNNGGDGWEAAVRLQARGWPVEVFAMKSAAQLEGDAARAANKWTGEVQGLKACDPSRFALVLDALFGAGLSRPLEGEPARLAMACVERTVIAADVPSGVHGDRARPDGPAFTAALTVTFHRYKPAHVLYPGRAACGEIVLAEIGVPDGWMDEATPVAEHNHPDLWNVPGLHIDADAHKHQRGRLCVLSGGHGASGAARLSAEAGLSAGAGYVTLLCPPDALTECAASMRAVVTRAYNPAADFSGVLDAHRAQAAVLGPGAGLTGDTRRRVLQACGQGAALVLDADALTVFEDDPAALYDALHERCVLTPHAGEFVRVFPASAETSDASGESSGENKIEIARNAASRAGAVLVLKGPDTVIAAPDGRVRVNTHASPRLSTAGTGDVLAGLIGAFLAQGADPFDAASAAVWIHGDAGGRMGPGDTAAGLADGLAPALRHVRDLQSRKAALRRLTQPRR
ncbi:NAD(P)H-hydrate dehydratase [Maricaulaceae bacterium MS644]